MKNYWIDNEGGVFMNKEQSMQDLVTNGYIKWYKSITEKEFKDVLIKGEIQCPGFTCIMIGNMKMTWGAAAAAEV